MRARSLRPGASLERHLCRASCRVAWLICSVITASWALRPVGADVPEADLRRDVRYLASDELEGRLTGSPGHWKAAQFIADRFRRLGLTAVGDDGYYQRYDFPCGATMGPGSRLQWGDAVWQDTPALTPISHGAAGTARGEVVFAGYGIRALAAGYDSYSSANARGRVVLVLSGTPGTGGEALGLERYATPQAKVAAAGEAGAVGLILVRTDRDGPSDTSLPFDTTGRGGLIPAVALSRTAALGVLGPGWTAVFSEDSGALARHMGEVVGQGLLTADVREVRTATANVAGLLVGRDPGLMWEHIVVGAHYDHVGVGVDGQIRNGADDNASGTSGVLALAHEFVAKRERPRRSILFIAFSGEEVGLVGSRHYVHSPLLPIARTRAMINLDMIGRLRGDALMAFATDSGVGMAQLVEEAATARGLTVTFGGRAPAGSDHVPFVEAGVPSVFLFTGMHPEYHGASDDWNLLNYLGEARVLNMVADLAEELANCDSPPEWVAAAPSEAFPQ